MFVDLVLCGRVTASEPGIPGFEFWLPHDLLTLVVGDIEMTNKLDLIDII